MTAPALRRKLLRELKGQRAQGIAVAAVMAVGVATFVSAAVGYLNLRTSYEQTQRRLALADWSFDVEGVDGSALAAVRAVEGVEAAALRATVELPFRMDSGRRPDGSEGPARLELRLHSLPEADPAARVDAVLLEQGELPGPGEALLETHVARYHGLDPGDAVDVDVAGLRRRVRVSGVAASAEYLWVARSRLESMPSPAEFGVAWMRRDDLAGLAEAVRGALFVGEISWVPDPGALLRAVHLRPLLASLEVAGRPDRGSELRVLLREGADAEAARRAVVQAVGEERVQGSTPRERMVGVELLRLDLDALQQIAAFFPLLFLTVGGFIVAALLSRQVDAQRAVIGTLRAHGLGAAGVARHYAAFSVLLGGSGAVLGALVGWPSAYGMTLGYARVLGIPYVTAEPRLGTVAAGAALGIAVSALAGAIPARRAARLLPAEAMRPPTPRIGWAVRASRRWTGWLPLAARLAARSVLRRPLRALSTAGGVAGALAVVLVTSGTVESMLRAMHVLFEVGNPYDVRADLLLPLPEERLEREADALRARGAQRVEVGVALPVYVEAPGHERYASLVQAMPAGSTLLRSVDWDGREVVPSGSDAVVSSSLARKLGLESGDLVRLRVMPDGASREVRIGGLSESGVGTTVTLSLAAAQEAFALDGKANAVLATAAPGRLPELRDAMQALPGAQRVMDVASLRVMVDEYLALFWALIGMMLAFSVVLAAAILFNTATLSVLERQREIATLRALGADFALVRRATTVENAAMALVGVVLGLPISAWLLREALSLYTSDLFSLPFVMSGRTVALAGAAVVGVLLLAQRPALRAVRRQSLADAVRERG